MFDSKKLARWREEHGREFTLVTDREDLDKVHAGQERKGKGREWRWYKVNIDTNDWNNQQNAEIWRKS